MRLVMPSEFKPRRNVDPAMAASNFALWGHFLKGDSPVIEPVATRQAASLIFLCFHRFRNTLTFAAAALLMVAAVSLASVAESKATSGTCVASIADLAGLNADDSTDVNAVKEYKEAVAQLLYKARYEQLDCLADSARLHKEKFPGGMWKLHLLYAGVEAPLRHATPQDWNTHLRLLKGWVSKKPRSITARIALAEAYLAYAWDARGGGFVDTVSESGWKLFEERTAEAKRVLEKAATLPTKCPEWYVAMQNVALSQNWSLADARALLNQASAFEPDYYYYYRMYANFVLPKWNGEPGDSEKSMKEDADRIDGERGDILYFEIAGSLICRCNNDLQVKRVSWPRLQRGFELLEKQNGPSMTNLNLLSYMAIKFKDFFLADKLFTRIGDQWSTDTWGNQSYFDQWKDYASKAASATSLQHLWREAADANMQASDGPAYKSAFEDKFKGFVQKCKLSAGADDGTFEVLISVSQDGFVEGWAAEPETKVSRCLQQTLMAPRRSDAKSPFPQPPQPHYKMRIDLDSPIHAAAAPN
jgi:hypothetical protein